ncbi:T9SS type A sorting domain-containing protein [Puia dinghuensis]|uniref:T9SS C-terminal target domain-containing protein n=1 Tax=Puia dinghuensis TaxID=1792502 RepID=A0A8J2XV43_9BACT|nr:T9SS type A sorting domain-containing protein [Puia dinghuensis]GGB14326.1 hypothetical protein GCM10011511_42660 [Puia dinghuensis]
MRLCRIQLSGVTVALWIVLISGVSTLVPCYLPAQGCTGTLASTTYDTVFTSNNGNTSFNYSVPKFPVNSLTLYAVTIRSIVTVNSGMTLTNIYSSSENASAQWYRTDDINSTPSGDFNNSVLSTKFIANGLAAGASKTFTPANVIHNNSIIVDSVYTGDGSFLPSNYSGSGKISFTYTASSDLLLVPSTSTVDTSASSFADQMHFSVTYYYCNPGVLATDLLSFTAVKQDNGTVLLGWSTANEHAGRRYDIEVSTDGTSFSGYTAVASDPVNTSESYSYAYPIEPAARGKLYFRLRIIDQLGPDHYSIVRIIDLDKASPAGNRFYIYPNPPTDHIELNIPGNNPQPWQVDILAADGSLVQRTMVNGTNALHVGFGRSLSGGAYFVRAVNPATGEQYTGSFVIR